MNVSPPFTRPRPNGDHADLPLPGRERWQPLRLGLVNLYRFDEEQFPFERGRLLLRGNNGTGKSRVLALSLPFLLDGEVAPHRLEPDGDPAKRIEWNLLLGHHDDRLGYCWLEFGRRDPEAGHRYLTLGCGLRAVRGRGLVQRWFFVTERRVDRDLSLTSDLGHALTRERLKEALGDRGDVFDTAVAYRAEVDRRLLGLGEHRYGALVELLIQLRRPQLSRQLDEAQLSDALSEALAPLPPGVIGDVAEAFRTLEADRDTLASFSAASEATRSFLAAYTRYAAVAVRRRVKAVTSANSDYETTQRRLREAEGDRDVAATELARVEADRNAARSDERRTGEEVRTLEASPAMDAARELERAREEAVSVARRADEADADRDRASETVAERELRVSAAERDAGTSRRQVTAAAAEADAVDENAALAEDHARVLSGLDLPDLRDAAVAAAAEAALSEATSRRQRAIAHLRLLAAAVERAAGDLRAARERQDELAGQLDAAREAEREAGAAREEAVTAVVAAYRHWAADAREALPTDPDEMAWELEVWRDTNTRSPLARAVEAAVTSGQRRLAGRRSDLAMRRMAAEAEQAAVAAEREHVATVRHLPPMASHTRAEQARATRPGAPLWQLVDLAGGVDDTTAAGYEAALETAGLLDAWVTPDGTVLDPTDRDAALVAAGSEPAPDGGLTRVLVPVRDPDAPYAAAVDQRIVAAVLTRIGADPDAGDVWVAPDGRFRLGPLHGAWTKPAAEHLGAAAREAARRRRLAELDEQLIVLTRRLGELDAERADLDAREQRLADEADTAPTDSPVRDAQAALLAISRQVASFRDRLAVAEQEVARRRGALRRVTDEQSAAAADLGLSDHLDELDQLNHAVSAYAAALARLWPTVAGHARVLDTLDREVADLGRARSELARLGERAGRLRDEAIAVAARRDTLEGTVGAKVEEVLARLEAAKARWSESTRRRERLDDRRVELGGDLRAAEQRSRDLSETLTADAARRQAAVERLAVAVDAGIVVVAGPTLDLGEEAAAGWSPDRAVRSARRIDQALEGVAVDDGTWSRVQGSIHGHFSELEHALLPHDLRPAASLDDDLFVVTTSFQGEARSMPALRDLLADEVSHRQALLSAREREILENHLIGDVAAHLHDLLRSGEAWVAEVNAELAAMPTSTGMKLRFAWQPRADGPADLKQARERLLAHHAGWSPSQREELGAFLQQRIAELREADDSGTWQQHLAHALDYRRWHIFVVERYQDGEWKRLTRRTHGTGSGGEKALALTVPQFAAAAAHYRSAGPHAPRLIMLDEAFVGIDSDMRAKCLGLLEQFDLDLMMTSEREWGCYPTVKGLAIAQLATRPGIDAVGVSRWVWNGRERVRSDEELKA